MSDQKECWMTDSEFKIIEEKEINNYKAGEILWNILKSKPDLCKKMDLPNGDEMYPEDFYKCVMIYSIRLSKKEKDLLFSSIGRRKPLKDGD